MSGWRTRAANELTSTWGWTREKPAIPGLYWARREGSTDSEAVLLERNEFMGHISYRVWVAGRGEAESVDRYALWCGPLVEPDLNVFGV